MSKLGAAFLVVVAGCATGVESPAPGSTPTALAPAAASATLTPASQHTLSGEDAVMARLQEETGFKCVRVADRDRAAPTQTYKDQLVAQAAAAGGPGNFLLPDEPPWAPGQMWIGDAAGAAAGYEAELVGVDDAIAWLVGPRDGELIGFELHQLDVGSDLSVWQVGDVIRPQPDSSCP